MPKNGELLAPVLAFLVTLRASRPGIFQDLFEKRTPIEEVTSKFEPISSDWHLAIVEPTMILGFLPETERDALIDKLAVERKSASTPTVYSIANKLEICNQLRRSYQHGYPAHLIRMLEMTIRFR